MIAPSPHVPMYSRNLDKALKSILSESPRLHKSREEGEKVESVVDEGSVELGSADDERGGGNSATDGQRENGAVTSISVSSQSRETTPSSALGGQVVDIPPFIALYEKEREGGRVSKQIREKALEMLKEWRTDWLAEDKRVRELKRKIKSFTATHSDTPPSPTTDGKSRSRASIGRGVVSGSGKGEEIPRRKTSGDSGAQKSADGETGARRLSVTGPNGLTGSYWDIPTEDMGRGSRRKPKG